MALITATQAGDWSDTTTWTGGVVPGASDDADLNGFSVDFDAAVIGLHIQVNSIISPASAGILTIAMDVIGDCEITCPGGITAGTVDMIRVSGTAPTNTFTINSDLTGGAGTGDVCLDISGNSIGVIVGDVTGGGSSSSHGIDCQTSATGGLDITGDVTGGGSNAYGVRVLNNDVTITGTLKGGSLGPGAHVAQTGSGSLTVVGNVESGGGSAAHGISMSTSTSPIHITGNVIAHQAHGIDDNGTGAGSITIIGGVIGSDTTFDVYGIDMIGIGTTTTVSITGSVTGGTARDAYGIKNRDASVTIVGDLIQGQSGAKALPLGGNNFAVNPVIGDFVQFGGTPEYVLGVSDVPDIGNVRDNDTLDGVPGTYTPVAESNVVTGIQYGTDGTELTGTLVEDYPAVGDVRVGATTDGVAGTYEPALVASYEDGETFGEDGTEFTGELVAGGGGGIDFTSCNKFGIS